MYYNVLHSLFGCGNECTELGVLVGNSLALIYYLWSDMSYGNLY